MATQEELASLFARNLSLQATQPTQVPRVNEPLGYSVSQHYHHSAHTIPPARPSSEPTCKELTCEEILMEHAIHPSMLSPSQISLFKTATPDQRQRLVALWRIVPPVYADIPALAHSMHTFEQEEQLAQSRFHQRTLHVQQEQAMLEERMSRVGADDCMSDDANDPVTPVQGTTGIWANVAAEPYMLSGYEEAAAREYEESMQGYRKALDPVYNTPGSGAVWVSDSQMTSQHGMYVPAQPHGNGEDEEML